LQCLQLAAEPVVSLETDPDESMRFRGLGELSNVINVDRGLSGVDVPRRSLKDCGGWFHGVSLVRKYSSRELRDNWKSLLDPLEVKLVRIGDEAKIGTVGQ
jgi:hypothetical protein